MKVMHLLQSAKFSGAENVVCQIISMCEGECEFVYCSVDGTIKKALEERQITYNLMKKFSISEIKRVIREEKPDLIHAHDMKASFYGALCCGKIPLISHVHNNNFDSRKVTLKAVLYYLAGRKAKHIFWVSESSFTGYRFHQTFQGKSTILHNMIDIDQLKNKAALDLENYDYEIVYLGRLTKAKNPQRVLSVLERVMEKRPGTKAALIGTGDLEDEILTTLKSNPKLNTVDFLGFRGNPYKILSQTKAMIMTSRWEGTPMCALEAMALGVPIVCTPTDGLTELIEEGKTGYLSTEDERLAEALLEILNDDCLHDMLSRQASIEAKKRNNPEVYRKTLLNVYRKNND